MKSNLIYLLLIALLVACNSSSERDSAPPPLFPQAKSIHLNPEGGYALNANTKDSIKPSTNNIGDTKVTGVAFAVKGRKIDPNSVAKPKSVRVPPKSELTRINAHPNVHQIPVNLSVSFVNQDSLTRVSYSLTRESFEKITAIDTSNFKKNGSKPKLITGIAIPAKGKVVKTIQPKPIKALAPGFIDAAIGNMQYLDVDQGMVSSYVSSMVEDHNGNLWFGTLGGGVSKYDGQSFTNYTEKEGLSYNYIRTMIVDHSGNLWFGTWGGGVSKYDGKSFTHYTEKEGLSNDYVSSILEDHNGNIWFGTWGAGVSKFDGHTFTHYNKKEGLSYDEIECILEDNSGNIWFGTNGGGVSKLVLNHSPSAENTKAEGSEINKIETGGSFIHYTKKNGLRDNRVLSLLEDKGGNIWFGTYDGGVSKFEPDSIGLGGRFISYTEKEGLSDHRILSIIEDKSGDIWFGTWDGGVSKYNGQTFTHFTKKEGLSNNPVRSILEDNSGNIWFSTGGRGVTKYNSKSFSHFTEKEGLSDNRVLSIIEDRKQNLWYGTNGGGVSMYDGESFLHYTEKEGLSNNRIKSAFEDRRGNIWFATWIAGVSKYTPDSIGTGGIFTHFTKEEGLSHNAVRSIVEDNSGNIWFGTWGGGVSKYTLDSTGAGGSFTHYTHKEGLSSNYVRSIILDDRGDLWFGTWGSGVIKYEADSLGTGGSFTQYTHKEGLSDNRVLTILEDHSKNLWFGTHDGGVSKFEPNNLGTDGRFTHFGKKEGLSDNRVWSILEDSTGNIWLGTEKGLNKLVTKNISNKQRGDEKIKKVTYTINQYQKNDGLKGIDFYRNSAYLDSKNRAWWGNGKSLSMLDLNKHKQAENPPVVNLRQLEINEQFIDYRNISDSIGFKIEFKEVHPFENYPLNLELPYDKNHLTFHFSGIDWSAPHKIQYSYFIEGLSTVWSQPNSEAKADFRNLPYGNFIFKVQAIGSSGQWSEAFDYKFTIHPPWWHTWWARAGYGIALLLLIWGFAKWRTAKLKKRQIELETEVEIATKEIKEQKNEAEKQRDEISKQKEAIVLQKDQILKQKEVAEEEREKATKSEAIKQEFLANMSHEIRTPMHAISGMVKILKRNKQYPEQEAYLQAMHSSSDNLIVILNDVLDLSKIEAGKLDIESIAIKPASIIENVIQILRFKAEEKGLIITSNIEADVPELIMGDSTRLNQILINLLGNSIKFTEKGSVSILLTKIEDKLRFSITDTGIGIPKNRIDIIFGAFEQATGSTSRIYGGTGLGLSISQQLTELQEGKIWVESEEGKGSTFFVELPLIYPSSDAMSQDLVTEERLKTMAASLKGAKILLVEDNAFNQMIAQDDLNYYIEDVKIDTVENGLLAIEKYQANEYDLILMDVQMPIMNGFEATQKIRDLEKAAGKENTIPIIAMTASLLKSEVDNCLAAGMNNYIPKPYQPQELIGPIYTELKKGKV